MAMDVVGKLIKILPEQSGTGKNGVWRKQDFVLETSDDKYPKKACLQAWGDKIDALHRFSIGDEIKVAFNIESREYNEKWYNDLRIWKVEAANGTTHSGNGEGGGYEKQSKQATPPDFPDVSTFKSSNSDEDNLPF